MRHISYIILSFAICHVVSYVICIYTLYTHIVTQVLDAFIYVHVFIYIHNQQHIISHLWLDSCNHHRIHKKHTHPGFV